MFQHHKISRFCDVTLQYKGQRKNDVSQRSQASFEETASKSHLSHQEEEDPRRTNPNREGTHQVSSEK